MKKSNNFRKQYEKDQQTFKSFDKTYRKSLQDNLIDKSEYESFCNNFAKYVEGNKNEYFFKVNVKKFFQ